MKHFIFNISVVLILAIVILFSLSWYDATNLRRIGFKLAPDTHIIAFGPSTTGCALNEQHIKGFQNLSRDGTPYFASAPLLSNILESNPQIDTVWISHGRLQFKQMRDRINNLEKSGIRNLLPLFCYNPQETQWKELLKNRNFYSTMLNPDVYNLIPKYKKNDIKDYRFGYLPNNQHNLYNDTAKWSIAWYDAQLRQDGGKEYTKEHLEKICSTNIYWLNKAIDICKEHNVVPVLFFTPLFQYDRWCTWDEFCDFMKDSDPNLLIADYEDFKFPNDSYYRDVHHLNTAGAEYFTSHIARYGIKLEKLKDWLTSKGY